MGKNKLTGPCKLRMASLNLALAKNKQRFPHSPPKTIQPHDTAEASTRKQLGCFND